MPTLWLTVIGWVVGIVGYAALGKMVYAGIAVLTAAAWGILRDRRLVIVCLLCVPGAGRMARYDALPAPVADEWRGALRIVDVRSDWQTQKLTVRSARGWGAVVEQPVDTALLRGMTIRVEGDFAATEPGKSAYTDSLLRQHIIGSITPAAPLVVIDRTDWRVAVERMRSRMQRRIAQTFSEPVSGVVVGMLLGIGSDVDPTVARAFRTSGTSHILVISGWNITIVAALCQLVLRRCAVRGVALLVIPIVCISVYVVFTGASAAVVRAGVMGVVIVIGKWLDRPRDMWNIIAVAVFGMSLADPTALWDLGFQLSTAATIGLIAFGTQIDTLLQRVGYGHASLDWAREGLAATIAAQIPTLPIMVFRMGTPSMWSLLANMLITPVVPYAMASGALATLAACIHPLFAAVCAWTALPAYHWIIDGSMAIAQLPAPARSTVPIPWLEWVCHLLWVACLCWRERAAIQRWYSTDEKRLKES